MLRPERVLGDVVDGAILVDHQDVVLAVAPRTWHIAKGGVPIIKMEI